MRTYAPAEPGAVLAELLAEPSLARGVVHHALLPARPAEHADFPDWLDPRIVAGLGSRGIARPYTHQAEAIESIHAGRDVVVVTPTASGKTLCYALPILQAIADDPAARALLLFPTKALGQDQVSEFGELTAAAGLTISTSTYDGDTPAPIRSTIRAAGQVVVTNPDMLHSAILPHHTKWFQLFEQLRYIVVDELHTYRGVFGSHVANVLRRLLRICAHYGSHPVIVCCSATIGNPAELATMLIGRPVELIDRNGAPAGRAACRPGRSADPPPGERRAGVGGDARPALGTPVPAGRPPDDRLRSIADRGRDPADGAARIASRELRTTQSRPRLSRRLPADRATGDRAWPARRRDPRRGRDERARARCRHRPSRRLDPGRLSGLRGRDVAAVRPGGPTARNERRDPGRVGSAGRPVRHPPPGVPARGLPGGGPSRPGQPARPARPPAGGHLRAAVRAGRTVRARGSRRPARLPRRGGSGPPGERRPLVLVERELPGLGDLAPDGGPRERRHHRHDARPSAGPRRGRPVQRPGPRPRAGDLHPRIGPVLRGSARVARAQGLRPSRRRRPLHLREPGGHPQAARGLRRGAGRSVDGGSTAR